jgi:hypothetical protein
MADHRIRLRGGWQWHEPEPGATRLVTLPMALAAGVPQPIHLVRPFNRPPIDPARETLLIHLQHVEGLRVVRLNDREVARPETEPRELWVAVEPPLPARNVLVLEAELPPPFRGTSSEDSPWGEVALVVRSAGD